MNKLKWLDIKGSPHHMTHNPPHTTAQHLKHTKAWHIYELPNNTKPQLTGQHNDVPTKAGIASYDGNIDLNLTICTLFMLRESKIMYEQVAHKWVPCRVHYGCNRGHNLVFLVCTCTHKNVLTFSRHHGEFHHFTNQSLFTKIPNCNWTLEIQPCQWKAQAVRSTLVIVLTQNQKLLSSQFSEEHVK
jgi:hypothetical protein